MCVWQHVDAQLCVAPACIVVLNPHSIQNLVWDETQGITLISFALVACGCLTVHQYQSHLVAATPLGQPKLGPLPRTQCMQERRAVRQAALLILPIPPGTLAGRWVIRHGPDDYKTGKQYGERPLLVLPSFLYPELEAFLATWRQHLKPQHLGLFCRESDGGQYTTGGVTSLFKCVGGAGQGLARWSSALVAVGALRSDLLQGAWGFQG